MLSNWDCYRDQLCMVMCHPTLTNSSTHGDISAMLPRDIDNGTVASDVSPLPPGLVHVEPALSMKTYSKGTALASGSSTLQRPTYRNTEVHSDMSIQSREDTVLTCTYWYHCSFMYSELRSDGTGCTCFTRSSCQS